MKKKSTIAKRITIFFFILVFVCTLFIWQKNHFASEGETTEQEGTQSQAIRTTIRNTLSTSSYIESALEETKSLHASYYFEECYFSENQAISEGEAILQYTNGTYLTAPYNCVITKMSLPESGEICTSKHYITIQSTDALKLSMKVDEDEKEQVQIGQEAVISIDVLPEKEITGMVTQISNTATYSSSGSTFEVIVEFQNDGDLLLGMTASGSIVLEKAEDVVAVAKEAVSTQNGVSSITLLNEDGSTQEVEIETGVENDAYIEIKSGIQEGDTVLIQDSEENTGNSFNFPMQQGGSGGSRGGGSFSEDMPDMSSMPDRSSMGQSMPSGFPE